MMLLHSRRLGFAGTAFLAAAVVTSPSARGAIEYDAALGAYRVSDYPKDYPCTPELLAEMDGLLGLGKVTRDRETGVCTVTCNLLIGSNDGTNTYFQVGSPEHPRETLVMRGNLYVCPYYVTGESRHAQWWHAPQRINRLTIGDEDNPAIQAALKFDAPASNERFWLVTGERPEPGGKHTVGRGGQLMVWHGLVTAAKQTKGHEIAGLRLRGDGFVLVNSTLSWVTGMMTYGAYTGWRKTIRVADSVLAHGGAAVVGGTQDLTNCRIVECDTAVLDYGSIDVVLKGCTLEGNRHNWSLRFPGKASPTLICIDCDIGPPRAGNLMQQQETASTRSFRAKGIPLQNPQLISKRHLVIQAIDAEGKPVPNAEIAVRPEQPGTDIDEGRRYLTGTAGRTADSDGPEAILLPEWRQVVTDSATPASPAQFTYTISAAAHGRTTELKGIRPDRSWKVVTVQLR